MNKQQTPLLLQVRTFVHLIFASSSVALFSTADWKLISVSYHQIINIRSDK